MPTDSFGTLGVPGPLTRHLADQGLTRPTPVQARVVPEALAGRDIAACAPTGTGKTLAFALPVAASVTGAAARPGRPRAVVITPTRELADQVGDTLADLLGAVGRRAVTLVGGEPVARQRTRLAMPADVVVVTPGRAVELTRTGTLDFGDVVALVIDEADELADLGFLPDVTALAALVPDTAQRLLVSATLDERTAPLAHEVLRDPVQITVGQGAPLDVAPVGSSRQALVVADLRRHLLLRVTGYAEADALVPWLAGREGRTILFVSAKTRVSQVSNLLFAAGVAHETLHGDRGRTARQKALAAFAEGTVNGGVDVLVATDVAARGLDVAGLDLVVHVDPPADAATYIHRSGRTARAGATGAVAAIVRDSQVAAVERMYAAAGVIPETIAAAPGSAELAAATGARKPRPPRPRRTHAAGPRKSRAHRPKRTKGGRGKGRRR